MAILSGFFDSVNKDRVYNAEFLALFHSALVSNGIYPNPSNNLQVVERENMSTAVKVGKAWINGHFMINTEDFVLIHDMADGALSRIDRIVLQLGTAEREVDIVLKKGTFASNPIAPAIVRNVDYYELVLADVRINAGTTQIIQGNITDQRLNNALCGITHGVVNQVDTTTIFNQYQSWFNDYSVTKAQEFVDWMINEQIIFSDWRDNEEALYYAWLQGRQDGFDAWFAAVKDILNSTADGNLLNRLQEHEDASMPHKFTDSATGTTYKWGMGAENGVPFMLIEEVDQ